VPPVGALAAATTVLGSEPLEPAESTLTGGYEACRRSGASS
jgi:hypothetical protein